MSDLLAMMRAAAEPTRLRVLVALEQVELSVGELCRVLEQSQPRVSRHLKLLSDAGLLVRHSEGTSAFYRPVPEGPGRDYLDAVLPLVDPDEPSLRRDRERLGFVRDERAEAAAAYFESVAEEWDRLRELHVADTEVEQAMLAATADMAGTHLLDVGTGTGRVLELFADRIVAGVGIDLSREMLNLARSRLDQQGIRNCVVRQCNIYDLDVEAGSMDVAVLHHVLHFLDDPAHAVQQAANTLRADGRLLVVDFAPHDLDALRTDFAHRRLGFADDRVAGWCTDAGLIDVRVQHLAPSSPTSGDALTVTLWTAGQRPDAPSVPRLRAAS